MAGHRHVAEGVSSENDKWNMILSGDYGGCMLSLIGGSRHGVIPLNSERGDGARLKIVKNLSTSELLSQPDWSNHHRSRAPHRKAQTS